MVSDKPARKKRSPARLVMLIFFAVGFVSLALGGLLLVDSYRFSQNSVAVTGTVISVGQSRGSDSVTYRPEFEFVDLRGLKRRGTTALSSSGYDFPVGSRQGIRYNPGMPGEVRLDSWFALWGFSLVFLAVGIVTLLIAKAVLTSMRRAKVPKQVGKKQPHWKTEKHYEERGPVKHSDDDRTYAPTVRRNR